MPNTLVGARFGEPLEIEQYVVDVGATSTEVCSKDPDRRYLHVVNDGNDVVYMMHEHEAKLHEGIRLAANGGLFEVLLCKDAFFAVSSKPRINRLLITIGR